MSVDLTPFGYTPTETLAYGALLELGPSSGYAVAKHVNIARANAYQALNGLVVKGGAAMIEQQPQRFRAVQPQALLARIADAEARKLDRLETAVRNQGRRGADALVPLEGLRSIQEVARRTIAGAVNDVLCVAPAGFLRALVPAFRKRAADGNPVEIWSFGPAGGSDAMAIQGEVPADHAAWSLDAPPALVASAEGSLAAVLGDQPVGYWTSDPVVGALIAATVQHLTA